MKRGQNGYRDSGGLCAAVACAVAWTRRRLGREYIHDVTWLTNRIAEEAADVEEGSVA